MPTTNDLLDSIKRKVRIAAKNVEANDGRHFAAIARQALGVAWVVEQDQEKRRLLMNVTDDLNRIYEEGERP